MHARHIPATCGHASGHASSFHCLHTPPPPHHASNRRRRRRRSRTHRRSTRRHPTRHHPTRRHQTRRRLTCCRSTCRDDLPPDVPPHRLLPPAPPTTATATPLTTVSPLAPATAPSVAATLPIATALAATIVAAVVWSPPPALRRAPPRTPGPRLPPCAFRRPSGEPLRGGFGATRPYLLRNLRSVPRCAAQKQGEGGGEDTREAPLFLGVCVFGVRGVACVALELTSTC